MLIPPGFVQRSVPTGLGQMVYYTNEQAPWDRREIGNKETLVFFHGFGGGSSAYEWSKVYPAFASDYHVVAPDLIGWGRSAHPERNYTPEDYVNVILEFMERINDRPTKVIASALTAALMIRAAVLRPDLFQLMILTTAAGLSEFGNDYQDNFFTKIAATPVIDRLLYNTGVATSFGIRSFLEQRQFAKRDRVYPEIVDAYLQSAQQPNAEYAALSFVRGDLCFDLTQYIQQLQVPTAMIWGQPSQYTGPKVGKTLAEMNPRAVKIFYQLDDVGFTPQLELPGVTIGLIRQFIPILEQAKSDMSAASV